MDIYPAIDLKEGQCVRLSQGRFDAVTAYSDDPLRVAQEWKDAGAKWLHVVDLDGARTGSPQEQNVAIAAVIVEQLGLPVQFGGGVRSVEAAKKMLGLGVSRVVVGTTAAHNAELAGELFALFGEQIAVGVDARDGVVAVHGWTEQSGENATSFVQRMAGLGAKRFIFTDIARDGMLQGVNVVALAQIAASVPHVPVIASGGVTRLSDIDALVHLRHTAPNVEGAIVGKALYAGTVTLPDVLARTGTN
jgi:phosphoribosylformimino-5-aminoimidazole carboxamide ribotide isomerase